MRRREFIRLIGAAAATWPIAARAQLTHSVPKNFGNAETLKHRLEVISRLDFVEG
jgi:hypothetical protein